MIATHTVSFARFILLTLASSAVWVVTASAQPRHFVLGMSNALSASERQQAWTATLEFITLQMKPGDALNAYDASTLQPVTEFNIPNEPLFDKPNPRLNRLSAPLGKLRTFFARKENEAQVSGLLMAPQFLELVGRQFRASAEEPLTVILLGAPYYADKEMAFDFGAEGAYPGDGFLRLPADESPFSTAEKPELLKNVALHWAWLREDRWSGDAHRQGVLRFWHLLARTQSGTLVSAAADVRTIFQRAAQGVTVPLLDAKMDENIKAEMILPRHHRAETATPSQPVTSTNVTTTVPDTAPAWLMQPTLPLPNVPPKVRGKVKIGLRWGDHDPDASKIDLDLYVQAKPGAKELSFRRTRSAEGWLWKDWVTSPSVANGFETVELFEETDIGQIAVSVNFFSGKHAGGVDAVIRIWVDGNVYEYPLRVSASEGNRGAATENRGQDSHWVVVDVPTTVGLRR